jgi:hypothetical protein
MSAYEELIERCASKTIGAIYEEDYRIILAEALRTLKTVIAESPDGRGAKAWRENMTHWLHECPLTPPKDTR